MTFVASAILVSVIDAIDCDSPFGLLLITKSVGGCPEDEYNKPIGSDISKWKFTNILWEVYDIETELCEKSINHTCEGKKTVHAILVSQFENIIKAGSSLKETAGVVVSASAKNLGIQCPKKVSIEDIDQVLSKMYNKLTE